MKRCSLPDRESLDDEDFERDLDGDSEEEHAERQNEGSEEEEEEEEDVNELASETADGASLEDDTAMEPFNLRTELAEGHFDKETGSYVPDKTVYDPLMNISSREMEKARLAQQRIWDQREKLESRRIELREELVSELKEFLKDGETVAQALQSRYRRPVFKKQMKMDDPLEDKRKQEVNRITELATSLLENHGLYNIYELTKSSLN